MPEVNQNGTTAGIVAAMSHTPAGKLRITEGRTVTLMRAPDRHLPMLGPFTPAEGPADVVLLYSRSQEQLVRDAPTAIEAVAAGGVLWVCYPKKSAGTPSDLSREACRDLMAPHGWAPAAQVSIDEVWSAMWFRPAAVGS
jgi:hypothetical protein